MYQFELRGLDSQTAFFRASGLLEEILSQFGIEEMHGIIVSSLEEFLQSYLEPDREVCIDYLIDHKEFIISFSFAEPFDRAHFDSMRDESLFILHKLVDEISFSSDNKTITFLFHVKRKPQSDEDYQQIDTQEEVILSNHETNKINFNA